MSEDDKGDPSRIRVQPLNAHNYFIWSNEIEILLRGKGLWEFVSTESNQEVDEEQAGSSRKRDLALAYLLMSIDASCKATVMTMRDPRLIWGKLKKSYQAVSEAAIDAKLTKLQGVRMTQNEPVIQYSNKIENLVNELAAAGHIVTNLEKKRALLRGLREEFSVMCQVIRSTGKDYEEAVSQLIIHESSVEETKGSETKALLTSNGNREHHWKRDSKRPPRKCYTCGRKGHISKECFMNPDGDNYRPEYKRKAAKADRPNDGNNIALLVNEKALATRAETTSRKWMVDSACTRHICNNRESFFNLTETTGTIQVGNKEEIAARGVGSVQVLSTVNGKIIPLLLQNVLYSPDIMYNLISSSQARKNGLRTEIDDDTKDPMKGLLQMIHKKSKMICLVAYETNEGLYEAFISVKKIEQVMLTQPQDKGIWHKRFGHVSNDVVKMSLPYIEGIKERDICNQEEVCRPCRLGKATRKPRKSIGMWGNKSKRPIERVYTDVVGPMRTPSLGGAKYFVTLIDEYSGYSMVRFMKHKTETGGFVREMILEAESLFNETIGTLYLIRRKKVKWLRSDGGGEYISDTFSEWLKERGIIHEITTAYSPESNGRAERLNRTLIDMARSMLLQTDPEVSKPFWAEGINSANYIRNRLVTKSTPEDRTPYEIIMGRKPDVSNIRIFGCTAYVHIPKARQHGKFAPRAMEGIMVGFCRGNAYRVFIPELGKVVSSQDVTFDERRIFNPKDDAEKSSLVSFEMNEQEEEYLQDGVQESDMDGPVVEPHNIEADIAEDPEGEPDVAPTQEGADDSLEDITHYPQLRRSSRQTAGEPPERLGFENVCLVTESLLSVESPSVPFTFQQAMCSESQSEWISAMEDEIKSLTEKEVWTLVTLPKERKAVRTKWVFDIKFDGENKPTRYKARLVAKGFSQKAGVDYFEIFSPVCRYSTARFVIALSLHYGWNRVQLDVKTAFLNARLDEEIYVTQPEGYVKDGQEQCVYKLHKALYGLKQASRLWNKLLESFLTERGFESSWADPSLFSNSNNGFVVLVVVYVDDLLVTGNSDAGIEHIISELKSAFTIRTCTDMGKFLGISIMKDAFGLKLHHKGMIERMLTFFNMVDCNPSSTPMPVGTNLFSEVNAMDFCESEKPFQQLLGALMHLSNTTRPDISYAVSYLSRSMHKPTNYAWNSAKGVLRYLKGTKSMGLRYKKQGGKSVMAFSDSDWGQERPERKSIGGYVFLFAGAAFSWKSKKQSVVAQSSVEAEYIALADTVREAQWIKKFERPFGSPKDLFEIAIGEDNQGCIALSDDRVVNNRSKHIDIKYQMIMDNVRKGLVGIIYIPTSEMTADIMTKALPRPCFEYLREKLGMEM